MIKKVLFAECCVPSDLWGVKWKILSGIVDWHFFSPYVCVCYSLSLSLLILNTLSVITPVDEDTEGSSRSGRESMSTSGDLTVGPGLNGNPYKDNKQNDRDKVGGKEKKKPERDKEKEKDKDKSKAKKGVLKGLGEMFR